MLISPDGSRMVITDSSGASLYTTAGEKVASVPGLESGDQLLRWASDSKTIFISNGDGPRVRVFRLDLSTGRRTLFREITAADSAGFMSTLHIVITPDGSAYAYAGFRLLSDLYLVEGLK
jgi:Tol biopolymer transport system component